MRVPVFLGSLTRKNWRCATPIAASMLLFSKKPRKFLGISLSLTMQLQWYCKYNFFLNLAKHRIIPWISPSLFPRPLNPSISNISLSSSGLFNYYCVCQYSSVRQVQTDRIDKSTPILIYIRNRNKMFSSLINIAIVVAVKNTGVWTVYCTHPTSPYFLISHPATQRMGPAGCHEIVWNLI